MHRRRWLQLGFTGTAILTVGAGLSALVEPGLDTGRLTPSGRRVMANIARAMLDGTLPAQAEAHRAAISQLLDRIDALVGGLPRHAQQELSQLLSLLSTFAGRRWLAGLNREWDEANVAQLQQALQSMRTSAIALRQQAYLALHDICGSAYFAHRSTWAALGYPGPVEV